MKRTFAVMLFAGALGANAESPSTSPLVPVFPPAPRIQYATNVLELGRVLGGSTVDLAFAFTNSGQETLTLNSVRSTCGCTKVREWTHSVAPGESGQIKLQLDAPNAAGSLSKTVLVSCNDPSRSEFAVKLLAQLWKAVDIAPPMVPFDFVSGRDTNLAKTVLITSTLEEPLELSAPECDRKDFQAELKPINPGRKFELTIRCMSKPIADSTLIFPVTLKTSSRELPVISLNVVAIVPRPIEVSPPRIVLLEPTSTPVRVEIRSHLDTALKLSSPTVSIPEAQVKLEETEPGRTFSLTLELPPGLTLTSGQNEKLTLDTSDPSHPKLEIPIVGRDLTAAFGRRGRARHSVVPNPSQQISTLAAANHERQASEGPAPVSSSPGPGSQPVPSTSQKSAADKVN